MLFFGFVPQFTAVEATLPVSLQILILGFVANLAFSLSDTVCIAFVRFLAAQAAASS